MNRERNAEIIRLWNKGVAARDIGRQLGITKNIIIGVVKRNRDLVTRPMVFCTREKGIMSSIVRWGVRRREIELRKTEPEWTPEQIIKVRKIQRAGGTVGDAIEALGTNLSYKAAYTRAAKLGIRFLAINRTHDGKSKLILQEERNSK